MKKRQRKKIIKKDWITRKIDFINGNKIDFEEALSWIDINLLSGFESADMSWIVYVGEDNNKEYDQGLDFCPKCANQKLKELYKNGEFVEEELCVRTDGSYECDGCEVCESCGINLDCSSLGSFINQELDHWDQYGCDLGVLFNLVQAGASQIEYIEEDCRAKKMLLRFFQKGEYIRVIRG